MKIAALLALGLVACGGAVSSGGDDAAAAPQREPAHAELEASRDAGRVCMVGEACDPASWVAFCDSSGNACMCDALTSPPSAIEGAACGDQ